MQQFEDIMGRIVGKALREQAENLGDAMGNHLCNKMLREVDELMVEQEQREEERYKRLDETIRSVQKARQEVAVSKDGTRKKSLFFRKISGNYNIYFRDIFLINENVKAWYSIINVISGFLELK